MIFRPVERSDLERLKPLLVSDPASALIADRFLVRFEAGEYHPACTWIAEESPDAEPASHDVAFYRDHMSGQRSWWRVAETPDGDLAGFGLPSRNTDVPVVGYLGVVPEHRGHGFAGEILAEITRILVAEVGATTIHADTDLENRPMAVAFEQAGYRPAGRRLVLSAS